MTQNCGPQKHPHYADPMVKLIYPPYKLYQILYSSCLWRILQNLDVFEITFEVTIQLGVNEDMLPAGVYCFRVSGIVCHRISHLQSNKDGERPKFAQLYIYDTDNKIQNRLHWNQHLKPDVLHTISSVINGVNPFVQFYNMLQIKLNKQATKANLLK